MDYNTAFTGTQARLLIELMTNESVAYKGNTLPDLYIIFGQLIAISNAQPVTKEPISSSS